MSLKSAIYDLLKLSNDINAIAKGKAGRRVVRRAGGKLTGRAFGKWLG